ncbi:hypothetical protein [Pontibacter vulgaris]|uniref:hypothetical protein n=1 Tax=Pontibacter vulgaris TaxID=2905679 RepID=UPI001FA76A4C|nr:hypothetical protein [Pontibacter vulgaris]
MKYMLKYSAALLLLMLAFSSCRKAPNYPDTPEIEFKRIEKYSYIKDGVPTDTLVFVIGFQDGDGNLGLSATSPEDKQAPFNFGSPYYNNFIVKFFRKEQQPDGSSAFVEYQFPVAGFDKSGRFPRLSTDDRSEPLEGEIRYKMELTQDLPLFDNGNTLKFEIFIYDRTTPTPNKSNVVLTDEVTLFQ